LDDQETMQQLVDLGYIEAPEDNINYAILKTRCDLKHNLARVFLGKKDFMKSKEILIKLINDDYPTYKDSDFKGKNAKNIKKQGFKVGDAIVDTIPFYMDLLTISLKEEDYNLADKYLKKLRKLDTKFEVSTNISEAKILLGKGKTQKALNLLMATKNRKPNSEIWYQIGNIYRRLNDFEKAKQAFQNAIDIEVDKAKPHQAIAETLIRLGEFEEAAEHALTAIELVKYFPEAHYTLGEALEKLGDLENAKKAYETASKLKPKKHFRAEKAIENIEEKIDSPREFKDKTEYKFRENQIVIVSGLPRSGTSVMMQMMQKGGLDILTDGNRKSDDSNPKGYYEYDPVMSLHKDNSWLDKAQNKSLKVVAPLLKFLDPKYRYKVIFMNRDLTEVVKSQQKMIGKNPDILPVKLFESYNKHLNQVEVWKEREPSVELIYVGYKDVIDNTKEVVDKVVSFIGVDMDKNEMENCVDKSLYRNKA
ncbi:MAG: tetratricopeptide repeat protein, partial [Bacteroidia bacterium]|nr:tetratricopeptide repeat protein [Bacteroidia bacterium]